MKNFIIFTTLFSSTVLFANININCFSSLFTHGETLQLKMTPSSSTVIWADKSNLLFGVKLTHKNSKDFSQTKKAGETIFSFFDSKNSKDTLYVSITKKQYKKFLVGRRFSVSAYAKNSRGLLYLSKKKFKCDN